MGRGVSQQWRTQAEAGGGGPLIDNGYHQVYTALNYVGSPAVRVYARIGRYVQDIEVEDTALVLIEHANGATTSLQVGWSALAGGIGVNEIIGTEGQIRFGGRESPVSVWRKATGEWTHPPVETEGPDELGLPVAVRRFVEAIENDGEVPVSAADGRHVLAIVLGGVSIRSERRGCGGRPTMNEKQFELNYILASCMYGTLPLAEIVPEVKKIGAAHIDIWPRVHGDQREQVESMGNDAFAELLATDGVGLGISTRFDLGPFGLAEEMAFAQEFGASLVVTGSKGPKGLSR